jgi:drug/metabolite transporter (DMT)-like permease
MRLPNLHLFALCVLIWGTTWLAITYQLGQVAQEMSVGYRFLLAGLTVFAFCWWRGIALRFDWRTHLDLFLMGLGMYCVSYIFVYYAESYVVSGIVAVGFSASPMLAMVFSRLFFGTPFTRPVFMGSLLGILGIVLVFWIEFSHLSASRNAALGSVYTALAVLVSGLGTMMAMRVQRRKVAVWPSMAWGMSYAGIVALLIGLAGGKTLAFLATPAYVLSLLYLAWLGSIVTFASYLTLVARIGAAPASYIGVMTPVVALLVSAAFEGLRWGWMTSAGVALLVVGNVFMLRAKSQAL